MGKVGLFSGGRSSRRGVLTALEGAAAQLAQHPSDTRVPLSPDRSSSIKPSEGLRQLCLASAHR